MKEPWISLSAERDIYAIWERIAPTSVDEADRAIAGLFAIFDLLGRTPAMRPGRPDLTNAGVFFWPFDEYLIVYRTPADRRLEIVAVTYGEKDIPTFFMHE